MSFEARCPQCLFVSSQLGQPMPCLLHVRLAASNDATPAEVDATEECVDPAQADAGFDEPYVFGQVKPTVDRPGPFTPREYSRLLVLRSRVQEERAAQLVTAESR
jgi:hypothetical protein